MNVLAGWLSLSQGYWCPRVKRSQEKESQDQSTPHQCPAEVQTEEASLYSPGQRRVDKFELLHVLKVLRYFCSERASFLPQLYGFKFSASLWSLNDFIFLEIIQYLFCLKLLILSQSGNAQELQNALLGDLALYVFILHQPINNPPLTALICWLPLFAVSFCHREPLTVISKFHKLQLCQIIK